MEEIFHWSERTESKENTRRMALTTRILDGFQDKVIESLKIAYSILVETSDLTDIKSFSVYHKDGCLYSHFEFLHADLGVDIKKLQASLKVEDELDWWSMREIFHTD